MSSTDKSRADEPRAEKIRSAIDDATVPDPGTLHRARMIVVDKLGEWDSLGVDEIVESVCEAYEAPSGEPLRLADVDPSGPATDTPAMRHLRYARAARTALIDLEREGTIVAVAEHPGDSEADTLTGEQTADDAIPGAEEVTATTETTGPAGRESGADELVLSTGPQPRGRRFALAAG
ncbi:MULTISPECIES: hypothetical protein [unclassified Dietzia]|uniref:hypothetical protein n=1 Tax=unclassified Dietzia TaxID=2617939 RepID=UPI0015FE69A3|nr:MULTISPECIES: hypothetical protein [unclassified Dietzia]MBB1025089.1 hypothetical protein [Dietzia sp. DQ12-76]MBB1027385.1 hypothetical protein [Dietzia sp. DQ11-38-2]